MTLDFRVVPGRFLAREWSAKIEKSNKQEKDNEQLESMQGQIKGWRRETTASLKSKAGMLKSLLTSRSLEFAKEAWELAHPNRLTLERVYRALKQTRRSLSGVQQGAGGRLIGPAPARLVTTGVGDHGCT
jgi:hypothetical protein